jgi:regulator of replication initiation timing
MVVKNSNIIQYALNKPELDKKLLKFDIIYKMDGSIYTIVETIKELKNTFKNCFENNNNLTFQLTRQSMLSGIPRIAPKMEYKLNINQYGDVIFIL